MFYFHIQKYDVRTAAQLRDSGDTMVAILLIIKTD